MHRRLSTLASLIICASLAAAAKADPVGPAGPVVTFAGQRFAICKGAAFCFESIAFDGLHRQIASEGKITDLCGGPISNGPDEAPGLAWESRTGLYWQILNDGAVRRWNGATLVDTAFVIPRTFNVPGSGPDTLEAPRGIAVDSTYVYVVDAGPNPGVISSNEWFKFTRTGTPVKSSKSTDFIQHLDADPDALVDDIVYAPHSSPVTPGLLLIALEHSGIQVIDTQGNYVDKMRWSTQSLPPGVKPAAFAGIAMDPSNGSIYCGNNDRDVAVVLTPLPPAGPGSYVVGTGATQAYLQFPHPGCNLSLMNSIAQNSLVFGIAYRPIDANVYGFDYATGDLLRFDPRSGAGSLVFHTAYTGVWGMAYDTDRDVLYGSLYTGPGSNMVILVIHLDTHTINALPNNVGYYADDIAFDPADGHIYGTSTVAGAGRLIKIDRDTGIGQPVGGNTTTMRGIEYDPVRAKFLVSDYRPILWQMDPTTAHMDSIGPLPDAIGWEGLAVVTVPATSGVSVHHPDRAGDPELRSFPNPTPGDARIQLDLAESAEVRAVVYDLGGRQVRDLHVGRLASGRHLVVWDGLDDRGVRAASGLYLVRVTAPGRSWTAKVVRIT